MGVIGAFNLKRGTWSINNNMTKDCIEQLAQNMRAEADAIESDLHLYLTAHCFKRGLKALLDFKLQHARFKIPTGHPQHKYLSKWMMEQRHAYFDLTQLQLAEPPVKRKNGEKLLMAKHIEFLKKTGFNWGW